MSWDDDVMANVNDELFWDPKVDSAAIAVSADDGKVTLRGTVGSLGEKREAKKAAEKVYGVISVDSKLQVPLMDDKRREDAELRGDVLQALMLDSMIPATVDAKVDEGFVTLTGTADWQYQREEAEHDRIERRRHGRRLRRHRAQSRSERRRRAGVDREGVQAERQDRRGRPRRLDRQGDRDHRRHGELVGRARRGARRCLGGAGRHFCERPPH